MAIKKLIKNLFHVNGAAVDDWYMEEALDGSMNLIIRVHLTKGSFCRHPYTRKKYPQYDNTYGYRRWRTLDLMETKVYIEACIPRIQLDDGSVITAYVPWARHNSGFTRCFEDTVVWMTKAMSKSAIADFMRISWNTVGPIISRVKNDLEPDLSVRWNNLHQIGIDETSYRKGHKYITVIVNHENNDVIWAAPGHDAETLSSFFEQLTDDQKKSIEAVTGDGAKWIEGVCRKYIPSAQFCIDPFHCIAWATEALDTVRTKETQKSAREYQEQHKDDPKHGKGRPKKGEDRPKDIRSRAIKNSKYALGKRPENLTENQAARLEMIKIHNPVLYRAYLLKEDLRLLFHLEAKDSITQELDKWLSRAQRCRIPEFVELGRKIRRHKEAIVKTLELGLSNARVEATNNKIKLIIRKAYGFRNITNMVDMILLHCSSLPIDLPNRKQKMIRRRDPELHTYYYVPVEN